MIPSMVDNDWEVHYQNELQQALSARSTGNEGKARVCARRAAGILINEYFRRKGISTPGPSVYESLRFFQTLPDVPKDTYNIVDHFLERVDTHFALPEDIDLIQDARRLAQRLFSKGEA